MEAAPFPNRLRAIDLSQSILVHMVQQQQFQLGDVIRAVTSNMPSSAMATYHLMQRRVTRYKQLQRQLSTDVQITVRIQSTRFHTEFLDEWVEFNARRARFSVISGAALTANR